MTGLEHQKPLTSMTIAPENQECKMVVCLLRQLGEYEYFLGDNTQSNEKDLSTYR